MTVQAPQLPVVATHVGALEAGLVADEIHQQEPRLHLERVLRSVDDGVDLDPFHQPSSVKGTHPDCLLSNGLTRKSNPSPFGRGWPKAG